MAPEDFKTGLTQARLKSLLHYEPETGVFTRLVRTSSRVTVGEQAGFVSRHTGYRRIKVDGHAYVASRLAWLYMTGEWPDALIDHQDTVKTNDAWANLRAATHAENMRNRHAAKSKEHPLKGVYLRKDAIRMRPWAAMIRLNGKLKHLGSFSRPEEAHAAYATAAEASFGSFARA